MASIWTLKTVNSLCSSVPSGCGKSTLLRMIAGLEDITDGTVAIGDTVVKRGCCIKTWRGDGFPNLCVVPTHDSKTKHVVWFEQIKTPKDEIERRVSAAAEILQIDDYLDRSPRNLSGGQRQRVAIGRAIVRDPCCVLVRRAACRTSTRRCALPYASWRSRVMHERLADHDDLRDAHDQVESDDIGRTRL